MYCKHCGLEANPNDNFCTNCGNPLMKVEQPINSSTITEEDYLKAYVGANYDKLNKKNGSLWTFIFKDCYLLYRKSYSTAIFLYLFFIASAIILPSPIYRIPQLIVLLIITFNFKEGYMEKAREKVKKIKNNNPEKTPEEILKLCKQKGGTNIFLAFLPFIITFVILMIMSGQS